MLQAQFSLDDSLWAFVQRSVDYGFQNRDELIGLALGKLQQKFQMLEASANLYTEEYADLRALTDSAIVGWVE
jgi:Arc/MetJ-type ribon-helix-helix transcriptional regulator